MASFDCAPDALLAISLEVIQFKVPTNLKKGANQKNRMANTYLIILVALVMLLMGFSLGRQLSLFSNTHTVSKLFVQRRWLFSAGTGIIFSVVIFLPLLYLIDGFTPGILAALAILVAAIAATYLGITMGWRPVSQAKPSRLTPEALQMHQLSRHISVDDSFQAVTISINIQKQWWAFVAFAVQMFTLGIFVLPILAQAISALLQNFLPENFLFIIWPVIGVLGLVTLYSMFQQIFETLATREVIEIDNQAMTITKHALGFKRQTQYPADNIVKILPMPPGFNSSGSGPGFRVSHPRGILRGHAFGRGVSATDAHKILETVYRRFPQYKG